ncbi:MAG TPA: DNA-3-methyladenine glycosylase I [Bacteroidales bacterium]|nr:DNA-3-methyladenine glycosylase I [Bacteroidales bacterium]HPS27624.1 DNA-3-methyladenine glycosylase I [Bacteroidales bacterium]
MKNRCPWPADDALMIKYHDAEWGVPLHDDRKLFEFMVLDAFQAGLSWKTILNKREAFREAFHNFDPVKISKYDDKKIAELLGNTGIIRNRQKILATIKNAQHFLEIQKEFGSFDAYIWQFTQHKMKVNKCKTIADIPSKSAESDIMSAELKKRGFSFVGSTICYAFMQAAGMVNDHLISCPRHKQVQR